MSEDAMDGVSLTGKVVVVTGCDSGIGIPTARELAGKGARLIMACRNKTKAEGVRRKIVQETGNEQVVVMIIDLASLASVKAFADEFNAKESRLDILVNNAGVLSGERRTTKDGFELDFGTNHLGHFYLTYLLLDKLLSSAPSRVVSLASNSCLLEKLDFDDLQTTRGWKVMKAYSRSKTAVILFSTHLAKLLQGTGVTTYSVNPGDIKTGIVRDINPCVLCCLTCLWRCFCCRVMTVEQGAATTLYCCLEPSIATHTGRFYSDSREARAKWFATDANIAERLWNASAELCKVSPEIRI